MSTTSFDLVIVGAGVAGLVLAARLAPHTDCRVAVVDAHPFPDLPAAGTFAPRVSALNHFSQHVLEALGVWSFCQPSAGVYRSMAVWDSRDNTIQFDCQEVHQSALGAIVENDRLRYHLLARLRELPNVTLYPATPVTQLVTTDEAAEVQLAGGACLSASLVVAADGARSWVREHAGFSVTEWDYGHTAIVAHVKTELPHQHVARQRFLPTGPLAFLPTPDPEWCSIVWSTSPEEAQRLVALEDALFSEAVQLAFEQRLGRVVDVTRRYHFPLTMRHATHYLQDRVVLLGDAAHTIHPLAGQGLNIGIQDAVELSQQLLASRQSGLSLACRKYLRRYERARKADNWQMILMMEFLKRIFASDAPEVQRFLSLGLSLTTRYGSLKKCFLKAAQGPVENISDCA